MDRIDYLTKARSRYTDQHANDPVFDKLVQAMLDQLSNNQNVLADLETLLYDIDLSEGALLDIIGYMVGQDRVIQGFSSELFGFKEDFTALGFGSLEDPEMGGYWYSLSGGRGSSVNISLADDPIYRRLIKARIIFNNNLATPETLLRIINLLTDTTSATIMEDNKGNLTIKVESDKDNLLTHFLSLLRTERNLIPIPLGVGVSLTITGTN